MNQDNPARPSARHARSRPASAVSATHRSVALVVAFAVLTTAYLAGSGNNVAHLSSTSTTTFNPLLSLRLVDATNGVTQKVDPAIPAVGRVAHQSRPVQSQSVCHRQARAAVTVPHVQRPVDRHPVQRPAAHHQTRSPRCHHYPASNGAAGEREGVACLERCCHDQ